MTPRGADARLSLDQQNRERRAVEDAVFAEAEAQLKSWFDAERHAAIVVGGAGWHPGVVGIVASRLQRRYYRPVVVVGFDEAGLGKGSGRSIAGLSLVSTLGECGHLLEKHGGHEMAAGLSMTEGKLAEFGRRFARVPGEAQRGATPGADAPRRGDFSRELSFLLLEQHASLMPFGMGNPEPYPFRSRGFVSGRAAGAEGEAPLAGAAPGARGAEGDLV
jgi:single-stranded-DNA-specific exonuclease